MLITNTVVVTKQIKSILFSSDGSLNITLAKLEGGNVVGEEQVKIDSVNSAAILDAMANPTLSVRQNITNSIYTQLVKLNLVAGTAV